jgi:DNA-binding GntR family transcriptional regulator
MLTDKIVDRESQQKLYVQMFSIIKGKIEQKEWIAGSQIPTEDELCRIYDVSKATVRMAIAELVRGGYLKKQQGKGTFVTSSALDRGITMQTKLTEDIFGEGVVTKKELLVRGIKEPPDDVRVLLQTNESVYYIMCKRVVNGEPAYLEESFIPLTSAPRIDEAEVCQKPFYELMQQQAEQKIYKVVQMIEISEMSGDAAAILRNGRGSSMLMLHRLLVGTDGTPIAYTRLMGSGRKYKLQTELIQLGA